MSLNIVDMVLTEQAEKSINHRPSAPRKCKTGDAYHHHFATRSQILSSPNMWKGIKTSPFLLCAFLLHTLNLQVLCLCAENKNRTEGPVMGFCPWGSEKIHGKPSWEGRPFDGVHLNLALTRSDGMGWSGVCKCLSRKPQPVGTWLCERAVLVLRTSSTASKIGVDDDDEQQLLRSNEKLGWFDEM